MNSGRARYLALLCFLPFGRAGAQTASSSVDVLQSIQGSTVTIRGSTSIGARWRCETKALESRLAVVPRSDSTRSRLPDVRGVTIHVPVAALRCQSGAMERAMHRALRADRDTAAQTIVGRFEIADDVPAAHDGVRHLFGALRVAGAERNVFLRSAIVVEPDGSLVVRSVVPLALTDFGIVPPRVLFGAVRARNGISVEVDLRYPTPRSWRSTATSAFERQ